MAAPLRLASPAGRLVLLATVLGSGMALLDATAVTVALPRIGSDLHVGFDGLQWTINAYTLTLSAFLLLGGALGDAHGRRRVFVIGAAWFGVASAGCALAPNGTALVLLRALQGVGGALMTPGSLAIIESGFDRRDRSAAVGAWSGLSGVASAAGPLLGGWLVQAVSWRLIFLINPPLAALVVWVAQRYVPETRNPQASRRIDVAGALLAAAGLGALVAALIHGPERGWTTADVVLLVAGCVMLVAFVVNEARTRFPMLPLALFRVGRFSAVNAVTFLVYGALGGSLFLLPVDLQRVAGYSPILAGTSLLPVTLLLLLLSARAGRLADRVGPRPLMTAGPILAGAGLALLSGTDAHSAYWLNVLLPVLVFAAGLTLTVAPLTATVLAAAGDENAGIASGVNNMVARAAGLLAVAALPPAAGIGAASYASATSFSHGFHRAMLIAGTLCALGGILSALTIRGPLRPVTEAEAAVAGEVAYKPVSPG